MRSKAMSISRASYLLFYALVLTSCANAECLKYEPEVVTLSGKLVRKTFPGLPNFESIRNGDDPETGFYLVVRNPICTVGDQSEPGSTPMTGVSLVQLLLRQKEYQELRPLLGKSVKIKGTLFSAHTAHHHAPILLKFLTVEK
ncbi:DUF4431 domain-containing protein [Parachitinimonas caeni]|uniref:DUF4431 domain-containing protein n=1 Tax=Parachitinimonas caeni TaxID=3031301 RepID=A0ABT7DZD5_9NEIS|nr:DUF4431 domain-containing protein [Parachitinimonas caeni]MDK2125417.1 DUF4431 domain-containing protein [Parachitinimonas caeni]